MKEIFEEMNKNIEDFYNEVDIFLKNIKGE